MESYRTRVLAAGAVLLLIIAAVAFYPGAPAEVFMPHAHCYLFNKPLMLLHGGSDLFIGLAYVAISTTLTWLVFNVRKELPFHWMMLAFALFIVACGATHFFEVWTLQAASPQYWLSGWVKLLTALASVVTAVLLPPLIPRIKGLLEGARLAGERKIKLETAYLELERLYSEIKRLDELRTSFFANVSHELRTPLTLISAPLDRLMKMETNAGALQELRMVRRNSMLLHKYVNDLLDISKLETGALELHYSKVSLTTMARFMESVFDSTLSDQRVEMEVRTEGEIVVEVDGDKIQRVILNLLSNALNCTPRGGSILLAVARIGEEVEIRVEDSGPGIAAGYRAKIFERFQMGDADTKKRFGGSGLGLSIVKEFVTQHHGTVEVGDSTLGGAMFTVRLPVQAPRDCSVQDSNWASTNVMYSRSGPDGGEVLQSREQHEESPSGVAQDHEPDLKKPLILVVEDNWDMSDFICRVLGEEGRLVTAANGREALDLMHLERPDIVVTDVMMPVMTGEELVAHMRDDKRLEHIPVLVLTARPADDNQPSMLLKGAQDYVTKPFLVEELRARVHNLLTAKLTRDALAMEVDSQTHDVAQIARELAGRARELAEANQAKDHFLAVLSHELRTPLTPALAAAIMLETAKEFDPAGVRETMGVIRRNIELEARLVDDLLDYTGISKGKLQMHMAPVDLHLAVQHALDMCEPLIKNKRLRLKTEFAATSHWILGDSARLSQIAWNFLLNAVKFTPENGCITVRTSNSAQNRVKLEVIDNGIGITADLLPHIFEPFRQGGEGLNRRFGGLGLGLSVAHGLAEAHGGAIQASSGGPSCGTTIGVDFDTLTPPVSVTSGLPPAAPAAGRSLRVLLVEDHDDTGRVLAQMLKRWGHTVVLAQSVAEGLAAAEEQGPFEVLLSDVGLPDGTGMDLLKKLGTKRPAHAIAVSGLGMAQDLELSRDAGFSQHLTKPVTAERLKLLLEQL